MVHLTNYSLFTLGKQTCLLLFREDGGAFADEEVRAIKKAERSTLYTQSSFVVMPADYSSFSFFRGRENLDFRAMCLVQIIK